MKKQFTLFKNNLKDYLIITSLTIVTTYILCTIGMNIDKIIYFFGTAYYYVGITLGLIETF